MSKIKILIIEDDRDIHKLLGDFLKNNNFQVYDAYDGREASYKLRQEEYDIVLMDLMLPHVSGEELIANYRKFSKVPVVVLSAKSEQDTKLEVLRIGADDYIIKPFDLDEVLVRLQVVLRRINMDINEEIDNQISYNDLVMDANNKQLFYKDAEVSLTATELQLLELLMTHPRKTFSKANLYEAVWQDTYYYEDNTINVHMSNLRNKLKKATSIDYIETVWGIGYRMKQNEK